MKFAVIVIVVVAALAVAGCGSSGPSAQAKQAFLVGRVQRACSAHGGIGYLNFDYDMLDEATCADGSRLIEGKE